MVILSFNTSATISLESLHAEEAAEASKVAIEAQRVRDINLKAAQEKARKQAKAAADKQAVIAKASAAKRANEATAAKVRQEKSDAANDERLADKYREQAYEDEIRNLELIERRAVAKARAENADRMVNAKIDSVVADVNIKKAEGDRIQSTADAARMEASGNKHLKEKIGEAVVNESKSLF